MNEHLESEPKEENSEEHKLQLFRAYMAELTRKEVAREVTSGHFFDKDGQMDAMELTEEDRLMWEKIENYPNLGPINRGEFNAYRDGVERSSNPSRNLFAAFLGNKLGVAWTRVDLESGK